jgi:hypothetical protein
MLIKIRKWLTVSGAFLFVLSVTYTAFTIDANLKKEAIKKLNSRKKDLEQIKVDVETGSPPSAPSTTTTTPTALKNSETIPSVQMTGKRCCSKTCANLHHLMNYIVQWDVSSFCNQTHQ